MKQSYPKIGIRPIIDGRRRGIRESLEETTMNLAKNAAKLFNENLRYPDGTPVECVIADTCIGGVKEASLCAEKFERENVGVSLSVTPCWCYGSETIDMDPHTPKAIWGFNGSERPGAVYLSAALAVHNQKGLPAFGIYGKDVQDMGDSEIPEDVKEKLLRFGRAGLAVAIMRGKSYLAIGSVCMGIGGSMVNPDFLQEYLGMRTEYVDSSEIIRRIEQEIYDKEEFKKAIEWVEKNCKPNELEDHNPDNLKKSREQKDADWEYVVKMFLIKRDLMEGNKKLSEMGHEEESMGHNAIMGGFQGQRQWTDFLPNGDFSEAILNTSFDWNGIRAPYIFATENDHLNAVSMLFGNLLTNTAQIFADVRTYWSAEAIERVSDWKPEGLISDGMIILKNSGACTLDATGDQTKDGKPVMKPHWEIEEHEVETTLKNTSWGPASLEYFRGGGYSSKILSKGDMPVTMCRINLVKGVGPVLQIAEGWTASLPDHVSDIIQSRTDPTWPTTYFVPRITGKGRFTDVYSVMNYWGSNHGAISYGHIGADLITLASALFIPVNMHNVDDKHIFRPDSWSAFGSDNEGSDFRACASYGPLYK